MKTTNLKYAKGATLIEVLITAIVIGVGLLGIAMLQLKSLQGSSDAQYRSTATDLAWTLADRMRANLPGFRDNQYRSVAPVNCGAAPKQCAMTPDGAKITEGNNCDTDEMAAWDLYEVACSDNGAAQLLPTGQMIVGCVDAANNPENCTDGSRADITVSWQTRQADEATPGTFLVDRINLRVIPGYDPLRLN